MIRKILFSVLPAFVVAAMCTSTWAADCGASGGGCEGGCEAAVSSECGSCGETASCGTKTVYQKQMVT